MARIKTILLATLLGFAFAPVAMADTLSIFNESNGVERPVEGMNMDQVRAKFGAAMEEMPPVGEPPITRWVYDGFTVYYEHQYVIHAVVHHDKKTDDGPLFLLD